MMLFNRYFKKEGKYLEIGPLDNPFLKKDKWNVKYLDYNDTDTVKALYTNTYANLDKIIDIDYATFGRSYRETVGEEKFDGVYSSHVIEHTVDLIAHFKDISDILDDGGVYFVVFPDKTHYADYFRQSTTFREVYEAHRNPNVILADIVAESVNGVSYNYDVKDFHNREISFAHNILGDDGRKDFINLIHDSDDPVSLSPMCHKWVFDEKSMLEIVRDCIRFQLIPFCVEDMICTSDESNFNIYMVLRKKTEVLSNRQIRIKELIKIQNRIEKLDNLRSPLSYIIDNISCKDFYVYGTGKYGVEVYEWLKSENASVKGFIYSDNQQIDINALPQEIRGDVYSLSNCKIENELIIIAVKNINNRSHIESELTKINMVRWKNYVCI